MRVIFPTLFAAAEDEESARYTACMALYVFEALQKALLIDEDPIDEKRCRRVNAFRI